MLDIKTLADKPTFLFQCLLLAQLHIAVSIPLIRTLLVVTLFAASALADDASLIVGHWRYENGGGTIDHYFEKDGRYKWVMAQDGKEGASSRGTYKLVDGVLQLYRDFLPPNKPPMEWRYTVNANNFTIIGGLSTNEKIENMVSKRVLDKK